MFGIVVDTNDEVLTDSLPVESINLARYVPVNNGNTALVFKPDTAAPISVDDSQVAPVVRFECLKRTLPPTLTSRSVAKSHDK